MSWEEINDKSEAGKKAGKEQKAKVAAMAKQYSACFSTPSGKAVIEHLVNVFIMDSGTNLNASNINYEAAYHNGEAGVVKYILNQLKRAQTL